MPMQPSWATGAPWALAMASVLALVVFSACNGIEYPNCNGDDACRARHEVCVQGHCQQCRADSDCGAHRRCLGNRCFDGDDACQTDAHCQPDQRCAGGHCVPRAECDAERPCPAGRPCLEGRCPPATDTADNEDPHDNEGSACRFEPVYFSFDNAQLDEASRQALQRTARCLEREAQTRYVLIGRCDPRGTTEYNLALGHRRASIVQHYLTSLGVSAPRVTTSSEGSEAATGTDEASWARDRRVDFRPRR